MMKMKTSKPEDHVLEFGWTRSIVLDPALRTEQRVKEYEEYHAAVAVAASVMKRGGS
jgi:hypothetical protein